MPTKRANFPAWGGSLTNLQREAASFRAMDEAGIRQAGLKAAGVIRTACQDIIFTEADLDEYADVAESTTTWADEENVWVGIRRDAPLKGKADDMNTRVFPVIETAFDMVRDEAVSAFETELRFL